MEDLIKRSLSGDYEAYIELIQSIQGELFKIAKSQLNNIDDINDAIQETIINSYNKLYTLKENKYFKTWIIRILINECNNIYRQNKKRSNLFSKVLSNSNLYNMRNYNNDFQCTENNIDFYILIEKLKPRERLILSLYYKNLYSPTEISNILNTNVNTIKSELYRAKNKLKKYYKKGGYDNERKE